jgi:hypothetical protein
MSQAYEVSLHELLEKVPADARLVIEHADGYGTSYIPVGRYCKQAAIALRAAIEQAERQEIEPDRDWVENDGCPTEKAVLQRFWREHQQAEKQEPVAWMYDWWDESEDLDGVPTGGEICDCITKDYDEAHSPTNGCHNIRSLYTAPPQREWQGLTDEEIDRALETTLGLHTFARAIEAKLKEKNT